MADVHSGLRSLLGGLTQVHGQLAPGADALGLGCNVRQLRVLLPFGTRFLSSFPWLPCIYCLRCAAALLPAWHWG